MKEDRKYREWKDYDDGLDYEDLVSYQGSEDVVNDDHARHQKSGGRNVNALNTLIHILGGSIGRLLGTATVVFAISVLFAMITIRLPNTKGVIEFKIKIDSVESQATAIVPGTEQDISTTITNDSGQTMYMFVRIDCGTYGNGGECIYSFTPTVLDEGEPRWTVIENVAEKNGQIILAWTNSDGKLRPVETQDSVGFSGTLKCVVPVQYFDGLEDKDMIVDFDGFGISTEESSDPKSAYVTNVVGRGK